jgi:hypothetical protein
MRERNRDLAVTSTNIQYGVAVFVREGEEGALLRGQHPLTDGISKTRRIFIRRRVNVSVLVVRDRVLDVWRVMALS